ncbi:MAG: hypothetical protein CML06_09660 [Pseudomonadales bacterium]|nr:hypothetical protein [Pseudomonadales bacterium]
MRALSVCILALFFVVGCASQQVQKIYQGDASRAARVTSAPQVLVKYVDNDEVSAGFIGQEVTYRIQAGNRTLMVEYSDLFNIDVDNHEKVVSRPAKVIFNAEPGKAYTIQVTPPLPKDLKAARALAEKPDFQVLEQGSGRVVDASVELSRPRSFMTQLKSAVTPVYEFESDQVDAGDSGPGATLDRLKSLWGEATQGEREAFMQWLIKQ